MVILSQDVLRKVSYDLKLPYTGTEQDWEIEMADANRLAEFVEYYKYTYLHSEAKIAVMALIISSYDDLLNLKMSHDFEDWNEIEILVKKDRKLFEGIIKYWSLEGSESGFFSITPLVRRLNNHYNSQ